VYGAAGNNAVVWIGLLALRGERGGRSATSSLECRDTIPTVASESAYFGSADGF
jgi:hypothetical protein